MLPPVLPFWGGRRRVAGKLPVLPGGPIFPGGPLTELTLGYYSINVVETVVSAAAAYYLHCGW